MMKSNRSGKRRIDLKILEKTEMIHCYPHGTSFTQTRSFQLDVFDLIGGM